MLIELTGGKSIDSEDPLFHKLSSEQQAALIERQTKVNERRAAKRLASLKCRTLKAGKPWPPEQAAN